MPRARWWVIGALAVVTAGVVLLDVTGVIFDEGPAASPVADVSPPPLPVGDGDLPSPVVVTAAAPDAAVVRRVERLLADPGLGPSVHAVVAPLADPDQPWTEVDADTAATPASTLKLWTAAATLDAFAPTDRISTTVAWDETSRTLVLVGGGDATLRTDAARADAGAVSHAASLGVLARQVVRELGPEVDRPVRLDFDTSLFSGPAVSPDWEPTYVTSGVIAPVTALMVDYGMVDPPSLSRYPDPALAAAETFADLLADRGVEVRERHGSVDVDDLPQSVEIASVLSPQIVDLVEQMLRNSDNQLAEALGRLSAGSQGLPLSFSGAARAIELAAESRGVDTSAAAVFDASGLSRKDRFATTGLVDALHSAVVDPTLAPVLSGLAVAGFDGTLADRYRSGLAATGAGLVRAKTGTLTGISAEAGVATSCDGDLIAFVVVADAVPDTEAARSVLDDVGAALASCS
jgi:D-alanyl-D-alanine carboxypeptidase/D-alanyl-D-alanine-endopeptidase (penicillin-binding protein 4)